MRKCDAQLLHGHDEVVSELVVYNDTNVAKPPVLWLMQLD